MFYSKTPAGVFTGQLDVEWIAPNRFIYRPNPQDPLRYQTSRGELIQPQLMYTDAGSIPRLFWSVPQLGPWDFGPGYIIHDWLFEQHHCKIGDWQAYDFAQSADILAEALKTQMEKSASPDPTIVWAVHEAVRSTVAERLWAEGSCTPVEVPTPAAPGQLQVDSPHGVRILSIRF